MSAMFRSFDPPFIHFWQGPIARLELLPVDATAAGSGEIIEAHTPLQTFSALDLKEGETQVLTPRKARVFVS
jgi:sulfate transport system ATP-binding protein